MKFEDFDYLKESGALLEPDKKRFELEFLSVDGKTNRIIGYVPSESMQIYSQLKTFSQKTI